MADRELLELAAKAAGIVIRRSRLEDPACVDMLIEDSVRNQHEFLGPWNPLTDDGDALRLAVKLRISPMLAETPPGNPEASYCIAHNTGPEWRTAEALHGCPYAATRRAIVRAAAEIGRSGEKQ